MSDPHNCNADEFRPITWADVSQRKDYPGIGVPVAAFRIKLEVDVIEFLRQGVLNSDTNRAYVADKRKLDVEGEVGRPNSSPSAKFKSEHAWVLTYLNNAGVIVKVDDLICCLGSGRYQTATLYRFDDVALAHWYALPHDERTAYRGGKNAIEAYKRRNKR